MPKESVWTLDIKNMAWVENTENEVDFLTKTMSLTGTERILDLACGFGRHSIAFAERGFKVVGVDATPDFIEDARNSAKARQLDIEFILSDIRDITFKEEFDVVLSLADGAIGYLDNDDENIKIFDRIASALKTDGKHFMDICNREHAEKCFPKKAWEVGSKALSLADFDWDSENKRMLYSESVIPFGEIAAKPNFTDQHPGIRLYSKREIREIFSHRGLSIIETFSNYSGAPDNIKELQLMVYSRKM